MQEVSQLRKTVRHGQILRPDKWRVTDQSIWLQDAPKLKVAIVGSGLAGLSTAVELLDQGHEVTIYEARPFVGGKVASFKDKDGNHIEVWSASHC